MKVFRLAAVAALAAATTIVPASAEHCSRVIIFSEIAAGRGVNLGVAGCDVEVNSNLIVPGAQRAIVAWTGGRQSKPAGTIAINGAESSLTGASWDAVTMRWNFAPVDMPPGSAAVRATVYPEADPSRPESVTYRKLA